MTIFLMFIQLKKFCKVGGDILEKKKTLLFIDLLSKLTDKSSEDLNDFQMILKSMKRIK